MTIITPDQAMRTARPLSYRLLSPPIETYHDGLKRVLDVSFAVVLFILALPLIALGTALVKLTSRGPVFFKQTRVGLLGREFEIVKLRTMVHNAEEGTGAVWCKANDPRVTRVGRFLRLTRIDELPQLWNVLRGDMSLVGPRPERPEFLPTLRRQVPGFDHRHRVRPGITGLAQVHFQYAASVEDAVVKTHYDLEYIREMGIWTDMKVLAKTVLVVLTFSGR